MDPEDQGHFAGSWRDRLAGRVPFDPPAAEAAIRRAYRASGLPEPRHILWAGGPQEAAQTIAFLQNPPRRVRLPALSGAFLGATGWTIIALMINQDALAGQSPLWAALISAVLAGFTVIWGGLRSFPMPAGIPVGRHGLRMVLIGLGLSLALWAYAFGLQWSGGLGTNPFFDGAGLTLAALLGASPGLLLYLRMRQAYKDLPRFLYELARPSPVARRMDRARGAAWASFHQFTPAWPDRSLLEAYRQAHWQGAALPQAQPMASDRLGGFRAMSQSGFGWIPPQVPSLVSISERPPHLDGIELASRAAGIERAAAEGLAQDFVDLAFHVDRLYPYETVALAVRPPKTVALDPEDRPHGEDGPALSWEDGTRVFAWHGQLVPPVFIEAGVPASCWQVEREPDPLRRSILIERFGLGRYLLETGAREIQRDECGRLYRLLQRRSEPIHAVRVVNHTAEPDGSFREFWLRVPPTVATAREAVAWTFDLPVGGYDPVAQS